MRKASIRRKIGIFTILTATSLCLLAASAFCYDGEIDFGYMGGAYMMEKSGIENDSISQFWEAIHAIAGIDRPAVKVENFVDEEALFRIMKKEAVITAGVSHSFFSKHEKELKLVPLVVPEIDHKIYIRYHIFIRSDNHTIQSDKDYSGKKISVPNYGDDWYIKKLLPDNLPRDFKLVKYPDNNSVVTAVLYKKADVGVSSEYYLSNYFALKPHLKDKIMITMKTREILLPPIVYQEGRLSETEKGKFIAILKDAQNHDELAYLLELMGYTGFRTITREEILRAVK